MIIDWIRKLGWAGLLSILIIPVGNAHAQTNPDIFFLPNKAPFTPYAKLPLLLGNGFTANGGPVTVKLIGNDAANTGYLFWLDPITGQTNFLFGNKDAEGTVIDLGTIPKGAPIVFMYVANKTSQTPKKYTGSNIAGTYNFDGSPDLAGLAVNHQAMPVSEETNDKNDNRWAIAGRATCSDVVFGFEDTKGGDYDYNDIVFLVTGVRLDSEIKLPPPVISGTRNFQVSANVTITLGLNSPTSTRIFYTRDGTDPVVNAQGIPQGTTSEYTGTFSISQDAVIKTMSWKLSDTIDSCASSVVYESSVVASASFTKGSKLDAPVINPPSGTLWTTGMSITITQAQGAEIHYVVCDLKAVCADPDSSSPKYLTPISLSQSSQVKAKAYRTGSPASEVAVALYGLNPLVASAVYLDENGDGRIDAVRITLNTAQDRLPDALTLIDPFDPSHTVKLVSSQLAFDPADSKVLTAQFPDQPFHFGTGFSDGPYGRFPSGPDAYDSQPFIIKDGVGPVAVSAEVIPRVAGSQEHLRVVFSEDVTVDQAIKAFPFSAIHPGGQEFGTGIVVVETKNLGNRTIEFTILAGTGPQPGDSLKLLPHSSITDVKGNSSNMGRYLVIGGVLPIGVEGGGYVIGEPIDHPAALVINVSVVNYVDPSLGRPGECLDCKTGEWKLDDPARPEVFPKGPILKINTKGAFSFDLRFLDHLGQYVNRAKGKVTDAMIRDVPTDSLGYKVVGLLWYPVSEEGQQAGTGVYIVNGKVSVESPSAGTPGDAVQITGGTSFIHLRMGYLR